MGGGPPGTQYNAYRNPVVGVSAYRTVAPSPTPSITGPGGASGPAAAGPYNAAFKPNTYGGPTPQGGPGQVGGLAPQSTTVGGNDSPQNLPGLGASAAITGGPAAQPAAPAPPNPPPRPPSSTGLIRLTLRKPMGIVFEPMTDPHNSAQQRGVRICDLPRTGAAALSRKLEVGDELLSINEKTMSRLTFDEIMDFIIEADPEKVNLLFRRPRKESLTIKKSIGSMDPFASPSASNNPSVKWMDESEAASQGSSKKDKDKSRDRGSGGGQDRSRDKGRGGKSSSKGKGNRDSSQKGSSRTRHKRDEISVVSGESSKYTRESTVQSVDNDGVDEDDRGRNSKSRSIGSRKLLNSENFLDMLIDSLCSPIIQADAACRGVDPSKNRRRSHDDYDSDDDDRTFDSAGDSTYVTYDDTISMDPEKDVLKKIRNNASQMMGGKDNSKHNSQDDESYITEQDAGTYDGDEGGSHTNRDNDVKNRGDKFGDRSRSVDLENWKTGKDGRKGVAVLSPPQEADEYIPEGNYEDDATLETVETLERAKEAANAVVAAASVQPPPLGLNPQPKSKNKLGGGDKGGVGRGPSSQDPISMNKLPLGMQDAVDMPTNQPKHIQDTSLSYDADTNLPISELEYDDRIDADVSVMESLGGPSLLIEAQRHNAAVAAGAAAAATNTPTGGTGRSTVSPEIISTYGRDYPQELGFTLEDTVNRNPSKFYTFVVRSLLEQHEPEKVRLLDKLLDKYSGREPHLIEKLAVRYNKQQMQANSGNKSGAKKASNKNTGRTTPPTIEEDDEEDHQKNDDVEQRESAKVRGMKGVPSTSPPTRKRFEDFSPRVDDDGWPPPIEPEEERNGKSPGLGSGSHDRSDNKNSDRGAPKPESDEDQGGDADDESASYSSDSDYSGDSIDGTSPAVIAQVSELLNYVYGKTSVPGQIDRVSTIMRAYEGREAVLLELLETKALIKANAENEAANNLPASLRNSPALVASRQQMDQNQQQQQPQEQSLVSLEQPHSSPEREQRQHQQQQHQHKHIDPSIVNSPVSGLTSTNSPINADDLSGSPGMKNDDVSSLSGYDDFNTRGNPAISSPISDNVQLEEKPISSGAHSKNQGEKIISVGSGGDDSENPRKKKSGLFGMFRGKKGKKGKNSDFGAFPSSSDGSHMSKNGKKGSGRSPKNGNKKGSLLSRVGSTEGSI
uniref:PDZ domain-containing protein n=1 Tax=Ditylum brightwellii TaxID=49249 RepID=A0A7S4QYJ0_9STRA